MVIYDDLNKHADCYRAISLLIRKAPSREAYPGDIFYLHAKLLERSGQLSLKLGGGSLTAIPIIETLSNNICALIPTNLISITDGQYFLSSITAKQGIHPAIDITKSVSRVGSKAQPELYKWLAPQFNYLVREYYKLNEFLELGTPLPRNQIRLYRLCKVLVSLTKQQGPLFFEVNVCILLSALLGKICYKNIDLSTLQNIKALNVNYIYLYLTLQSKTVQNNNFIKVVKLLITYHISNI